MNQEFLDNKKFVFTIIDDTDDAFLENIKPVYDFLYKKGIKITKSVWVYPVRDKFSKGDSLERNDYRNYILELKEKGFEIALHNVGSGEFKRREIISGLETYRNILGEYPKMHINHSYNQDSIYGGDKRFNWPFNKIVKKLYPQYSGIFQGEIKGSKYFWGDKHKEIIKFNRNHETDNINTFKFDPFMPYIDPTREKYSNYWFSATFAPNQKVFNHVVTKKSIDKLERENGICIIFTHLGYFIKNGEIDKGFIEKINYLSQKKTLLSLPVSDVLEQIISSRKNLGLDPTPKIPRFAKFKMEFKHLLTRLKYRKFIKMDDYTFKNLSKEMFLESKK